jgi:hypothetical protein
MVGLVAEIRVLGASAKVATNTRRSTVVRHVELPEDNTEFTALKITNMGVIVNIIRKLL